LPDILNCPLEEVTGVDIDENYLKFARQKYWERVTGMGADWYGTKLNFVNHDAVDYTHLSLVDVIIASSAYHHIEDERKLEFLRKVQVQLKDDGLAVFCENLIGNYHNLTERAIAVTDFYAERIKEMARLGISDRRLGLVCRVLQYELDREYEWKHSYREFTDNLQKAGLKVVNEAKVWPTEDLFRDPKVGDFVFEVKKNA
jgi:SAM-dependent methyltransferase